MRCSFRTLGRLLVVLLLVLQINALPLHEFALIQQGYTLVGYTDGSSSGPATASLTSASSDTKPYDVSSCWYHHQILALSSFLALFVLLVGELCTDTFRTYLRRTFFANGSNRLSANPKRAPPVSLRTT